jgi:hypothetical protein
MTKRALFAVAVFLGLHSLPAQPLEQPLFGGSILDNPSFPTPWASLENREQFFFSTAFGSMRTTEEFLPDFNPAEPLNMAYLPSSPSRNSLDKITDLRAPDPIRFGGEMGFLYGKSTGKYGREDFAGYIIGTVGNDKFSITAGYLRQETTFSGPRWRR